VSGDEHSGASILVVEDDEQIAELMRDFLEAEGYRDAARRVRIRHLPPAAP
jgi:DNA-binding response OmpR family regulator